MSEIVMSPVSLDGTFWDYLKEDERLEYAEFIAANSRDMYPHISEDDEKAALDWLSARGLAEDLGISIVE